MADFARESKEKKANPFKALVAENGSDVFNGAEILVLSLFGVALSGVVASGISGCTVELRIGGGGDGNPFLRVTGIVICDPSNLIPM